MAITLASFDPMSGVRRLSARGARYLVLLALVTSGALIVWTAARSEKVARTLSARVIDRANGQLRAELRRFTDPIEAQLRTARSWGQSGLVPLDEPARLYPMFLGLVGNTPYLSSMLIVRDDGAIFRLSRVPEDRPGAAPGATRWQTPEESARPVGGLTAGGERFDPFDRAWYRGALEHPDGEIAWTRPYAFFGGGEPGVTASTRWRSEGRTHVIAFDVRLTDVTVFTAGALGDLGYAVAIGRSGVVIGFPDEADLDDAAKHFPTQANAVRNPMVAAAADLWARGGQGQESFRFEVDGEAAWARFVPERLATDRELWLGVVVPEAKLTGHFAEQRRVVIGVALGGLALAALLAWLLKRAIGRTVGEAVEQVGQYRIVERIGAGGMGTVYKAYHALLRRPTAIKLLSSSFSKDATAAKRFEREVQITSRLTHPNTVAVYDYGWNAQGVLYYAMEYLPGTDLQRLVEATGPLPPARVVHVLRQVCGSLAEAHAAGLIHRDIKPANIILCERGGKLDVVKVLDFGLAKQIAGGRAEQTQLTDPDAVPGTPIYTAPEVVAGPPAEVGPAADLYAVGAVAYFLLTGEIVFDGASVMAVWNQHLHEDPVRPSERLGRPLPEALESLVLACLSKDPADRPESAAFMEAALEALPGIRAWTDADARAWWREHCTCVDEAKAKEVDARGPTDVSPLREVCIDFHASSRRGEAV